MFFLLLLFLVPFSLSYGTILSVPIEYPSIQSACNNAQHRDTILLAPGIYTESISLNTNLTIASRWILSGDTTDIDSVQWRSSFRIMISPSSGLRFQFGGLRFVAMPQPVDSARLVDGLRDTVQLNSCRVEGVFTSTRFFSTGLFDIHDSSVFEANDCRFFGDSIAATPIVLCYTVTLNRCYFSGRTNSTQYRELMPAIRSYLKLTILDSYFDIRGEGPSGTVFRIERTRFVRGNQAMIAIGGNRRGDRIFESCTFDSLDMNNLFPAIWLSHLVDSVVFNRCTFTNTTGNGMTSIMNSYSPVVLRNCTFTNNQGLTSLIEGNLINIRQSRFYDNATAILQRRDLSATDVYIETSDFVRNPALCLNAQLYDTIAAPDCYWGHASGPNHILNPGGQGVALPNYVRPFPFRTTPVFPDVFAPEPLTQTGIALPQSLQFSLYPNPTNGSTTIRFSLPPTSPVTGLIYDRIGRQVTTFSLDDVYRRNGVYPLSLVNAPSGMYFVRLSTPQISATQPLLLVK